MRNFALGFVSALLMVVAVGVFGSIRAQGWMVANGVAFHLNGGSHCNTFTAGFGVELPMAKDWRAALGVYDNSNCKLSTYAAGVWTPLHFGSLHFGGIAGLVTGYRSAVLPAGGPALAYESRRWGLNLIYIPPVNSSGGNVAWIQAKVPW